jgi:HEAT repeat protein
MSGPDSSLRNSLLAIDTTRIAVTAAIDERGVLQPIGGITPKMIALFEQAAKAGGPRILVVAEKQEGIDARLEKANPSFPFRVLRAGSLEDGVKKLYEEDGPRGALRRFEADQTRGLELIGHDKPVSLLALYQELPLLREIKREKLPRQRERRRRLWERSEQRETEDPRTFGPDLASIRRWEEQMRSERVEYEPRRYRVDEVFANYKVVFKEAKSDVPRLVVIGPPGSGKSTLIQLLAHRAATGDLTLNGVRLLPVRVKLRDWEDWVISQADTSLPRYLANRPRSQELTEAPSADQWLRWLQQGDVLLLLDGLDEVAGTEKYRTALKEALKLFERCPTVITCRTISFESHRVLVSDFGVFTLDALEDGQRNTYIDAYGRMAIHKDKFNAPKLIDQLNRLHTMRPLAANPLLLSLICFVIDHPDAPDLPATRGEIYTLAIDRLLARKRRVEIMDFGNVWKKPESTKREILERAALDLFAGQDSQRKLTIDEADLVTALRVAGKPKGLLEREAELFLQDLTENCGLVRGDRFQGYFFLHPTLQEFLAAARLAQIVNKNRGWEAKLTLGGRQRTVREWIDKKAWDSRWEEVICLFTGQVNDPELVLKMLSNPRPTRTNRNGDDVLNHRLALAARCVPEIPAAGRATASDTIGRITTSAFAEHNRLPPAPPKRCIHRAFPSLASVDVTLQAYPRPGIFRLLPLWGSEPRPRENLLARIAELLRDANPSVRLEAARAVHYLGAAAATETILSRIAELLRDTDRDVRPAAVRAVCGLGAAAATEPFLERITELLGDAHWLVREAAADAVGGLGAAAATGPIMARIAQLLADTHWKVRCAAARAVRGLGAVAATEPILARLAELLHDARWRARHEAAAAVGGLGTAAATDWFLARIAELLGDAEWEVGYATAQAVGGLGATATDWFLARIAELLRDPEPRVRSSAARAVGGLAAAATNETILARIVELLRDPEPRVRSSAARAVRGLGAMAANETILARIAELLGHADWYVRSAAVRAVGGLGAAASNETILVRLVELLGDVNSDLRSATADAFGGLGPKAATETTLSRLVVFLGDEKKVVRFAAVRAVAGLGPGAATKPILTAIEMILNRAKTRADFRVLGLTAFLVCSLSIVLNEIAGKILKISVQQTTLGLGLTALALAAWCFGVQSWGEDERLVFGEVAPAVANLDNPAVDSQSPQIEALALRCQARLKALSRARHAYDAIDSLELLDPKQA